jgi:formamidopyrimidine-DNA glycosylase
VPEYPDLTVYIEALTRDFVGHEVRALRIASPFVVRTFEPRPQLIVGRRLAGLARIGKRLVFDFGDELYLVLHLMIAGRLREKPVGAPVSKKVGLLAIDFDHAALMLTEASPKKRASVHMVQGRAGLAEHDPGGLEPLTASYEHFAAQLRSENHTLKRALCDPTLFAAIGNAYSDEILHRARLSPLQLTSKLEEAGVRALYDAVHTVLPEWTARLRDACGGAFPDTVTAFHAEMAVHGRYGEPCPVCGSPVQRIRRADNETNYCATCQTGGRLLADRSLSRLMHDDWPKTLEELELKKRR